MNKASEIWEKTIPYIKDNVSAVGFKTAFEKVRPAYIEGDTFYLYTDNKLYNSGGVFPLLCLPVRIYPPAMVKKRPAPLRRKKTPLCRAYLRKKRGAGYSKAYRKHTFPNLRPRLCAHFCNGG